VTTSAVSNRAQGQAPPAAADTKRSRRRAANITGWAFMAPFGVFFALFLIWPILYGLYLSFTGTTLTGANADFVGFANYAEALGDPDMWRSMGNTLWFTVLSTIPLVLIALVMALLVDLGLPGQWLWRLSFFLPFLLASTVASLIWVWMFNPQLGLINAMLAPFGVEPIAWLQDPAWAMHGVVIDTVWWTIGFNFLLYLAALQNIPEQQYEAASIDGAGKWRQLFSITIPQLGPTTGLIIILQILASLKVFDQIFQMTTGGPGGATRSAVVYIFETGFTGYRFGYSAAISFVFFAIIIIISIIQIVVRRSRGERS
jgi:multiple sugar transport system permease protein